MGETSTMWGRTVQTAKRPGDELTKGRNVLLPTGLFALSAGFTKIDLFAL